MLHVMSHDHDGALVFQGKQQIFYFGRSDRVECGAGLVQQQNFRMDRQGPRNAQPLLLAARERIRRLVQLVLHLFPQRCALQAVFYGILQPTAKTIHLQPVAAFSKIDLGNGSTFEFGERSDPGGESGKDPEVRSTQDGSKIVDLTLATSETWNDRASGERKEKTEWHRVVVFNDRVADVAERFLKKGAKIYVEGSLQTRKWTDQQGQNATPGSGDRALQRSAYDAGYAVGRRGR